MCLVSHWELGAGPINFAAGILSKLGHPKRGTTGALATGRPSQPGSAVTPCPQLWDYSQGQGTKEKAARTYSEGSEIHIAVTLLVGLEKGIYTGQEAGFAHHHPALFQKHTGLWRWKLSDGLEHPHLAIQALLLAPALPTPTLQLLGL